MPRHCRLLAEMMKAKRVTCPLLAVEYVYLLGGPISKDIAHVSVHITTPPHHPR